ncbi:hypothetical protein GLW08_18765 [Pontibacillus yanchengensis]|uniref:Uncharacterized protein n=1 Tax=Pontibacillus yanchengensis TaxID=462910 RepID=A0ACC7VK60_9BACI|nr:hypothetical protein [Pontibacillus yanchengensis]MYL55358.1 hypothetical protein [Pontibacillus yanchengensis]
MKEEIEAQYDIIVGREWNQFGVKGYESSDGYVALLPAHNVTDEEVFEQRSLSEYLLSNQWPYTTLPIFTKEGALRTTIENQEYMLVYVGELFSKDQSHGSWLARFHELGQQYPYQPQHISRYGKWKTLWEEKMDAWTALYKQQWDIHPASSFQRLFIETYPYLEGVVENAIQYLQESEQDWRYEQYDQGTFTVQRLHPSLLDQTIWSNTIVYDHPSRDIAEWIRYQLLEKGESGFQDIRAFMDDYEAIRPLSIFGWRLVYARLILPINLFDRLDEWFNHTNHSGRTQEDQLRHELENQVNYEKILHHFFEGIRLDVNKVRIPTLDWY